MSQAHIDALTEARENIRAEHHLFVCNALPKNKYGIEIKTGINCALKDLGTVRNWLAKNSSQDLPDSDPRMIAYRIKWIDEVLIPEWENAP